MAKNRPKLRISKGAVNRAGNTIRAYMAAPRPWPDRTDLSYWESFADAYTVAVHFRECHAYPLQKATMGVRSMTRSSLGEARPVTQRLKRMPTIIDKLGREPGMNLARMADVGGCRVIVNSLDEAYTVATRINRNHKERGRKDYMETPKDSGYRALHVIVEYDERLIEVQLRTRAQHAWAMFVERLMSLSGEDFKSGLGTEVVLSFLRLAAEGMAMEDRSVQPSDKFMATFENARRDAFAALPKRR